MASADRRVRNWFAEHWSTLVPAVLIAAGSSLYLGPALGLVVWCICQSIDLGFFTAVWIGFAVSFAGLTYTIWCVFDWIRRLRHTAHRNRTPMCS